jgi:hypothetical protein
MVSFVGRTGVSSKTRRGERANDVGADPRVCPPLLGEHTGSPLHCLSSFPRRRESRRFRTYSPCMVDPRLRGDDEYRDPITQTKVLENKHGRIREPRISQGQ